jgi:HD-GYP domain-containing protein (c-di-GMP phosphodiesterase class II)
LEKSNEYAYSHALSTSIWCGHFGRHLGFEVNEIEELALGGMLLDLGKIKLPPALLNKVEKITVPEASIIRKHVDYSLRILAKSKNISPNVMRMVATHHERANGKGYPQGIENKDIPIYGRIAGIVDSYDAMTTPRPYSKKTMSPNEAINELYKLRDTSFQSELVEQFIQTVGLYPTGSLVELNSGAVAIVLEVNDLKRLYPTVMIVLDRMHEPVEDFETINLAESESGLIVNKALPTGAFGINIEELFI